MHLLKPPCHTKAYVCSPLFTSTLDYTFVGGLSNDHAIATQGSFQEFQFHVGDGPRVKIQIDKASETVGASRGARQGS